jgi:hypothetical protein
VTGTRLTPTEIALRGRIGAFALHAQYDPRDTTRAAREAFLAKFEREVDPDGLLSPEERIRRAEYARKAHFTRLALASARKRSKNIKKAAVVQTTASAEARDAGTHSPN